MLTFPKNQIIGKDMNSFFKSWALVAFSGILFLHPILSVEAKTAKNFFNVLTQDGADPSVYKHTDGLYYSSYTTGGDIRLWKHSSLSGMESAESVVIWSGCCNVWAPEIQFINNSWNIYFAKDDGDNANHRMFVLHNESADPFKGKWTLSKLSDPSNDQWAIDGIAIKNKGQLYFVWSGWDNQNNSDQSIYIATMDSPTHINGKRVKISRPQYDWETNTTPMVNEGPEIIVKNETISLVYSASGSWTDSYVLGMVNANVNSDLLNPASWTKNSEPLFKSGNGLYGPGHHSFTKSPDNKEDWIVYHTARWQGSGWTRNIRAQRFSWSSDDTPYLGLPTDPDTLIALPSGEVAHDRYEAELATIGGNASIIPTSSGSGAMKVGYMDTSKDYLEFNVTAAEEGVHNLTVRAANGSAGSEIAHLKIKVNAEAATPLYVVNSGWDRWTNASTKVYLKKGANKIRISQDLYFAEIDCIDLYK
jgi:GH43 family beta-xylosidase